LTGKQLQHSNSLRDPFVRGRIAEYCDGWPPIDLGINLEDGLNAVRAEVERRGRSFKDPPLGVLMNLETAAARSLEKRAHEVLRLGFQRIVFRRPTELLEKQWPLLEHYARVIRKLTNIYHRKGQAILSICGAPSGTGARAAAGCARLKTSRGGICGTIASGCGADRIPAMVLTLGIGAGEGHGEGRSPSAATLNDGETSWPKCHRIFGRCQISSYR
jgi:hypothetical protein